MHNNLVFSTVNAKKSSKILLYRKKILAVCKLVLKGSMSSSCDARNKYSLYPNGNSVKEQGGKETKSNRTFGH